MCPCWSDGVHLYQHELPGDQEIWDISFTCTITVYCLFCFDEVNRLGCAVNLISRSIYKPLECKLWGWRWGAASPVTVCSSQNLILLQTLSSLLLRMRALVLDRVKECLFIPWSCDGLCFQWESHPACSLEYNLMDICVQLILCPPHSFSFTGLNFLAML